MVLAVVVFCPLALYFRRGSNVGHSGRSLSGFAFENQNLQQLWGRVANDVTLIYVRDTGNYRNESNYKEKTSWSSQMSLPNIAERCQSENRERLRRKSPPYLEKLFLNTFSECLRCLEAFLKETRFRFSFSVFAWNFSYIFHAPYRANAEYSRGARSLLSSQTFRVKIFLHSSYNLTPPPLPPPPPSYPPSPPPPSASPPPLLLFLLLLLLLLLQDEGNILAGLRVIFYLFIC